MILILGEIKKYLEDENQYKGKELLKQNMKKLKELIYLNFDAYTNTLMITLNLDQHNATTNLKLMKNYLRNFFRRLKLRYKNFYDFGYIYKCERQENKNWHTHILLKDMKNRKIFLDNYTISEIWGKGFAYSTKKWSYWHYYEL